MLNGNPASTFWRFLHVNTTHSKLLKSSVYLNMKANGIITINRPTMNEESNSIPMQGTPEPNVKAGVGFRLFVYAAKRRRCTKFVAARRGIPISWLYIERLATHRIRSKRYWLPPHLLLALRRSFGCNWRLLLNSLQRWFDSLQQSLYAARAAFHSAFKNDFFHLWLPVVKQGNLQSLFNLFFSNCVQWDVDLAQSINSPVLCFSSEIIFRFLFWPPFGHVRERLYNGDKLVLQGKEHQSMDSF